MSELILYHHTTHQELGRREMAEDERYTLYSAYTHGELLTFQGSKYRIYSVAWQVPQRHCIVQVTWDSYEAGMFPYDD